MNLHDIIITCGNIMWKGKIDIWRIIMNSSKFETTKLWRSTMKRIRLLAEIKGKGISETVDEVISDSINNVDERDIKERADKIKENMKDQLNAYT